MQGQTSVEPRRRRILIVEDHLVVRHGLVQIINQEPDLEICGEADDVSGALACLPEVSPDLVLVDLSLRASSGLDLIKEIKKSYPMLPVLVLSMHDELLHGQSALQAGAKGYIMKRADPDSLMNAIRRVLNGDTHISAQLVGRLLDRSLSEHGDAWRTSIDRLSTREREVFQLIGKGLATREVADSLGLSVKTIESHRESIKTKLGLNRATELQRAAFQWVEAEKAREP
jgi:DNA-binding NarL/FixJ family response regulator